MSEIQTELQLQLVEWGTQYLGAGRDGIRELCHMYGQDPIFAMLVSEGLPISVYQRTPDLDLSSDLEVERFVNSHNAVSGEDYTLIACVGGEARSLWIPTCLSRSGDYKGNLFNHVLKLQDVPINRPVRRGIPWVWLENMVKTSQIIEGKLYFEDPMSLEWLPVDTLVLALDLSPAKAQTTVRMIILLLQALSERHKGQQMLPLALMISAGDEHTHRQYSIEYHKYIGV